MVNRVTTRHEREDNTMHTFKLYIFMDENRLKQKLRLEMLINE